MSCTGEPGGFPISRSRAAGYTGGKATSRLRRCAMPRLVAFLLLGLVLLPATAGPGPEVAPAPRAKIHVAPPPRLPGEPLVLDLTNEDPGLDIDLSIPT